MDFNLAVTLRESARRGPGKPAVIRCRDTRPGSSWYSGRRLCFSVPYAASIFMFPVSVPVQDLVQQPELGLRE